MADKTYNGIQFPNKTSGQGRDADPGFVRLYFKNGNIFVVDENSVDTKLTGVAETDPVFMASAASNVTNTNITNWNTAYGWGNHASAGYLTGVALNNISDVTITSPSNGQVLKYNGTIWVNAADEGGSGGASISISDTAPSSPSAGALWWDSELGKLFIYYSDTDSSQWVEAVPSGFNISSGTGGGGGALGDLTDVTVASVADGDLLRYNGTAGEWQNTNLGLSVTPTLSAVSTQYLSGNATITNWGTYQDPAAFAQLKNSGGTVVVTNDNIAVDGSGNITFTLPGTVGTYTLEVQVQDFGDLASEVGTVNITKAGAAFRYWRIGNFVYSGASHTMVRDFSLFTGSGQTGTEYPPVMTANNAPSPYIASAQGTYTPSTTYDPWTAFNNNLAAGWWNLGTTTSSTDYLQIDLGQLRNILSLSVNINPSYTVTDFTIYASNTGAFSGEEVELITYQNDTAISSVVNIG